MVQTSLNTLTLRQLRKFEVGGWERSASRFWHCWKKRFRWGSCKNPRELWNHKHEQDNCNFWYETVALFNLSINCRKHRRRQFEDGLPPIDPLHIRAILQTNMEKTTVVHHMWIFGTPALTCSRTFL